MADLRELQRQEAEARQKMIDQANYGFQTKAAEPKRKRKKN